MVQLQTQLMTAFRVINDLSDKSDQTVLPALLKTQNTLVSIYDFIENNEGNLRLIELLQEIDYLTPELRELKSMFLLDKQRLNEDQVQELFENVNSAKLFLTEVQEGLMQHDALVQIFMQENQTTVDKLQSTLIEVENKLQSATCNEIKQDEAIQTLSNLLNDVKTNIEKLQSIETTEMEKTDNAAEDLKQTSAEPKMLSEREADKSTKVLQQSEGEIAVKKFSDFEVPQQISEEPELKRDLNSTKKQLAPFIVDVLQLINSTNSYLQSLTASDVQQTISTLANAITKNLKEIQSAIEENEGTAAIEDALFLPLFKSKELISKAMPFETSDETADIESMQDLFENLLQVLKSLPNLLRETTQESIANALEKLTDNDNLQELKNMLQDVTDTSTNQEKRKCIFKLKETIVHTYDGSLKEDFENN
ncbi:hypothetical protein EVAR_73738_1 [Eumeta japonica]|uniref:Uncharacterized protein n=1 Tax=Eumeta variegata TaxID=151549 RepID=A0A4C1T456_EUMVA|nr:hypothetical protein EVAR_73738_1 [Eumeta japonica]